MPLSVSCSCGHKFRVETDFRGKEGPCPACGQTVKLEGPKVPAFDVFLSYSSKDKTIADAAVAVLEQRGLRCWVAPRNIVAGKEWGESIIEGIEQSGLMVLIFSQHSNQSQQVVREVERAVAKGIPILPFRIEDIPASKAMEYFISCHHWLDAFNPPLEKHLEKLADMAGQLLGNAPSPKTESDDAKSVAGKLNAAVGTLLARDRRVRVLTSLAAVLVVAALIVAASVFATRDPVASAEVIRAKAEAEVLAKALHELDPAQGFGERISAVDQEINAAAALFSDKQFSKALKSYQQALAEGKQVAELEKQRHEADDKRTGMDTARKAAQAAHAEQFAKDQWSNAKSEAEFAAEAYARADFRNASEHWKNSAVAYSAAADGAKKTGLPRLKALALHTSMAINNRWWFETLRPQPRTAAQGGFDPNTGFVPGFQARAGLPFGGGLPDLRPAADDWPPYQATIQRDTAFLDSEARDDLGVDSVLIEKLISTRDPAILNATGNKIIEQIVSLHGSDVGMAYRLGTNVAKLKILCDLGVATSYDNGFGGGSGLKKPSRSDLIWSTDYVMHRAMACGLPSEIPGQIKEIRRIFDEQSDGLNHGDYGLTFAFKKMQDKTNNVWDKHFDTLGATTALFAKSNPPADPPQFPSREQAVNDLITELEKRNGWFLFDLERWDRPPVSLVFRFDEFGIRPEYVPLDPLFESVVKLSSLRRLGMRDLPLQDQHLARIAELKELREVWIGSEAITAEGMQHLAKLPRLEDIKLYDTNATDEEIAPLAGSRSLKEIALYGTKVSDSAAKTLATISTLERVYLGTTTVGDNAVEDLKVLKSLTALGLDGTQVTDACAPHLAELANLEYLSVEDTGLTDESLPHLKKLTKLKELDVSGTKITREGSEELKKALPMCEVSGN